MNMDEKMIERAFLAFLLVLGTYYVFLATQTDFIGEDEVAYIWYGERIAILKPIIGGLPPLVPTLYAPFFMLTPETYHLAVAKAVICVFGIATLFVVYFIGRKHGVMAGMFSVLLLLSIPLFTHLSFISYLEIPIAFFSALVVYFSFSLNSLKKSAVLGVVLAMAFYTKGSGIILTGVVLLYALMLLLLFENRAYFKFAVVACMISVALITPWALANIAIHNYPFVEGINMLFEAEYAVLRMSTGEIVDFERSDHPYYTQAATMTKSSVNYLATFGWMVLILGFMGSTYALLRRYRVPFLSLFVCFIFIAAFTIMVGEPRYLSLIFPQVAIVGGVFLGELTDTFKDETGKKYAVICGTLIMVVGYLSLTSSLATAMQTSSSRRYSDDYVNALKWIRGNTPDDAYIFTVYGGSTFFYARRDAVWAIIKEFPLMMEPTSNSTYIHQTLGRYNVTHVFIDSSLVADTYFIPHLNIVGLFSKHFVDEVVGDTDNFRVVYTGNRVVLMELL